MQARHDGRSITDWAKAWRNFDVVAIASGPSLTDEDLLRVQKWRSRGGDRRVIVTNTTFVRVPWADALFGFDNKWWKHHIANVDRLFHGHRLSAAAIDPAWKVTKVGPPHVKTFGNCGTACISFSVWAGAARVIMLAYDVGPGPKGEIHHHGDHPNGMSNAFSMPQWPSKFENVARFAQSKGVELVNASRSTTLTCIPRVSLAQALRRAVAA